MTGIEGGGVVEAACWFSGEEVKQRLSRLSPGKTVEVVDENLSCLVQDVAFQDARRVLFDQREAGVFGEGQSTTMMNDGVGLVVRVWGWCLCCQLVGGDGQRRCARMVVLSESEAAILLRLSNCRCWW